MTVKISPQPGPQTTFLSSSADIAIYGGAAGGGKTYALLLDFIRSCLSFPGCNGALFRREATDLKKPGAIVDESKKIYYHAGGHFDNQELKWKFSNNSQVKFSGMQYEKDKNAWQGSQLDVLGFDELTHFTEDQFWYLTGRLRSVTGKINPYCRGTTNPEPGSWVHKLIEWYIQEDGYPDPERAGVIRWFYKEEGDNIYWFPNKYEAEQHIKNRDLQNTFPRSFTFIPANINDNQILIKNNPNYYATLAQLPYDERMKLLEGNWLVRPSGKLFKASWFTTYYVSISDPTGSIITCDTASDIKSANDYTVFQYWTFKNGKIYLERQLRGKWDYQTQLQLLKSFILETNPNYVMIEKAATGHSLLQDVPREVSVPLVSVTRTKDKYARAYETQAYIQSGYVNLNVKADYYTSLMAELTQFSPDNKTKNSIHDDQVDCLVDAIYYLLIKKIFQRMEKPAYDYTTQYTLPVIRLNSLL